jgi:phage-related minor tail protein
MANDISIDDLQKNIDKINNNIKNVSTNAKNSKNKLEKINKKLDLEEKQLMELMKTLSIYEQSYMNMENLPKDKVQLKLDVILDNLRTLRLDLADIIRK